MTDICKLKHTETFLKPLQAWSDFFEHAWILLSDTAQLGILLV